jgi:hypothetical protein
VTVSSGLFEGQDIIKIGTNSLIEKYHSLKNGTISTATLAKVKCNFIVHMHQVCEL